MVLLTNQVLSHRAKTWNQCYRWEWPTFVVCSFYLLRRRHLTSSIHFKQAWSYQVKSTVPPACLLPVVESLRLYSITICWFSFSVCGSFGQFLLLSLPYFCGPFILFLCNYFNSVFCLPFWVSMLAFLQVLKTVCITFYRCSDVNVTRFYVPLNVWNRFCNCYLLLVYYFKFGLS